MSCITKTSPQGAIAPLWRYLLISCASLLLLVASVSAVEAKNPAVRNAETYMRLEQLEQEIQSLRNLVEIQANQLRQDAASQRSRYLDLDQRLQEQTTKLNKLEENQILANAAAGVTLPTSSSSTPTAQAPVQPQAVNAKQAYDAAYSQVTQRNFNGAIASFKRFINDYPQSNLVGNAYYWLGEIYLAQNTTQEAKQMFLAVTNNYPRSFKIADSKYKLALIEARYGNAAQAKRLMQQLIQEHPREAAADLAKAYLSKNP